MSNRVPKRTSSQRDESEEIKCVIPYFIIVVDKPVPKEDIPSKSVTICFTEYTMYITFMHVLAKLNIHNLRVCGGLEYENIPELVKRQSNDLDFYIDELQRVLEIDMRPVSLDIFMMKSTHPFLADTTVCACSASKLIYDLSRNHLGTKKIRLTKPKNKEEEPRYEPEPEFDSSLQPEPGPTHRQVHTLTVPPRIVRHADDIYSFNPDHDNESL